MQRAITQLAQAITTPGWMENGKLDETWFCEDFLEQYPMVCVHGSLFNEDGRIPDEDLLRKEICRWIGPYIKQSQKQKADSLLELLKVHTCASYLPIEPDRIHLKNGTLFLDGSFTLEKTFCRNRLPICYDPLPPEPVLWKKFLSELLEEEDILTLQEYLGYCLIPTTKAQRMLLLIGRGGEGKSRIGMVMRALFGDNMANGNLAKVETNRFARADLEHMLVMVDDDMKLEALPQTNYIKTIVTADVPLDLEQKGKQSYQATLYCRFLGFGNGSLQALYDRTHGFYRRQILLSAKRRPEDRIDDPDLGQKLCWEKEGIFLWCVEGLQRLIRQNYRFTLSRRSRENLAEAISEGNNIVEFMDSEGYIQQGADLEISSRELYGSYVLWCEDNALRPLAQHSFSGFLIENQQRYHLEYTNNIYIGNGKRVRGFLGIGPVRHMY